MGFEYLTNVPLDEARGEYLARLQENGFAGQTEMVSVQNAFGRITARAVYAAICAPHYAASAMDGIAVHAKDTFGATETTPVRLTPQQYMVVDTGDPVPEDCDAVIMVEDIVRGEDEAVTIYAAAAPWQHIRQIGEDICAGEMILASYMEVTPAAIGAMIAGGVLEIEVIKSQSLESFRLVMRSWHHVPIQNQEISLSLIRRSFQRWCRNGALRRKPIRSCRIALMRFVKWLRERPMSATLCF